MEAIHVIKRPLLSEKSTWATEDNRYTFLVACEATKTEIKRAVEEIYGVRVTGVSTMNRRSRNRRMRYGLVKGKTTKKAIVGVHRDDTIELF
ncbi:MAG: 50S ribosomal protein L23 [Phycisphaerales bacterium]|nr:50S ribosomal protein L23 [Phycisphaerales bacterium]